MLNTIIWDWNGTLLDDLTQCVQVINRMLAKRNLNSISADDYKRLFTFPVINYYQALGFDFTKEDYRIAADEFINTYHQELPNCQLQPYALQMLEYFKNLGFQQIIFSAMEENSLNKTLAQFQLTGYFKHIFGTQNVLAESKLHKLLQLKKAIDQTTQKICYIGDTVHDADAAKELGCPCFLVANGHYDVTRLKATNYPVIADLSYLPQALKPFNVF